MGKFLRVFSPPERKENSCVSEHKKKIKWYALMHMLLVLLFSSASIQNVYALECEASKIQVNYSNIESDGYVEFTIPYFADLTGAVNEWFKGGRKEMWTVVDGVETMVFAFSDGNNSDNPPTLLNKDNDATYAYIAESKIVVNQTRFMKVRWYITNAFFGKTIKFHYYASIEKDNDNNDPFQSDAYTSEYKIKTLNCLDNGTVSLGGLNEFNVTFNLSQDYPAGSQFDIYQEGTNASYQILTSKTLKEKIQRSAAERKYNISLKKTYSNQNGKLVEEVVNKSIQVKGYQAIRNFKASYNPDGKVVLTWNLENGRGDVVSGDMFKIQRADNPQFTNAVDVGDVRVETGNGIQFTYEDVVKDDFINGRQYYRITRSHSLNDWGWSFGKSLSVDIDLQHVEILSADVDLIEYDGRDAAKITWTHNGTDKIWTDGSKFVIVRNNLTEGTAQEISGISTIDNIDKMEYIDTAIKSCSEYSYEVYVLPGDDRYGLNKNVTGVILPSTIGELITFDVSKGYYSNRVELKWTSVGAFDKFIVKRRIYGSNDKFEQVLTVDGSKVMEEYMTDDVNCIPGVIYEYQVAGYVNCSSEVIVSNSLEGIGFRTPTGDIYGRVTFENGQAVADVEVRAEVAEGSGLTGKSYRFNSGSDVLTVDNGKLLGQATQTATLEAWVKAETEGSIVEKPGALRLYYEGGKIKFAAGNQTIESKSDLSEYTSSADFAHVTAVMDEAFLYIYINDKEEAKVQRTAQVTGNENKVVLGGNGYVGNIDEVRIWTVALDSATVARDYGRYLIGNETGLAAYYTFDYSVDDSFYDTSYNGSIYNKNHGTVSGAVVDADNIPTISQLGYKGYTGTDGSYTIRALPYAGNGTTYMIIPRLGIHQFESEKELRLLNTNSQSHTVNFIDKSSFEVSGTVRYSGGTVPVQGVSFTVDGVTVMDSKANIIKTDAQGNFTINVPVGTHEVKAVLVNHTFELDGRITNSDGTDRNYQDRITGIELWDNTTVKYIGRVAGGAIQEAYPLGHSLSKNNLADGVKVELKYENDAYRMFENESDTLYKHLNANPYIDEEHANEVNFNQNVITIYPDAKTGEFIAYVRPEKYKVVVTVPGHQSDAIAGNNSEVNLTNVFTLQSSVNSYVDSVSVKDEYINRSDSVFYNQAQKFILRYTPTIRVYQMDESSMVKEFFGVETVEIPTLNPDETQKHLIWDTESKTYTLGLPVFEQASMVTLGIDVFEEYKYKTESGDDKPEVAADEVPTQDAVIKFGGDLPFIGEAERGDIVADSIGHAIYTFQVNNPELTAAKRSLSATVTYGDSENPTSIDWKGKFDAVVVGARMRGTNFITAGPDKILFVLRDPPGSNSYSYLEKGTTITKSSSFTAGGFNEGSEIGSTKAGTKVITFVGIGAGTVTENDVHNEYNIGVSHSERGGDTSTTESETTTTTRFQTSADPEYVGANGDMYVGYSTNISYGATDNIQIITKEQYDSNPGDYTVYSQITSEDKPLLLVQSVGLGLTQKYGTLFAYPQIHIERVLIPQMIDYRNQILHQETEMTADQFQALADRDNTPVYVSKLDPEDENYGKSNTDEVFVYENERDPYDGKSYKIYFPQGATAKNDTILAMNQSIDNWYKLMEKNEEDKVKAELIQNYSYQAGSAVEVGESLSTTESSTSNWEIVLSVDFATSIGLTLNTSGFILDIQEKAGTELSGESSSGTTESKSQGFVFEDSGTDYLSVDVCREADDADDKEMSTFIFKTKAGATSCPYEAGYTTKYYQPGQHVIDEPTVQIEVPEITVEDDFIEHVPSGEYAYFTLFIRNNSESQDDSWYDLKLVDGTNPNGAELIMDGAPIGNGRTLLVPAGETLVKTLAVGKGSVLNYDGLQLQLMSQCQCDPTGFTPVIADTVTFSVHYTPSCTDVKIKTPANNWTYNTKLPVEEIEGVEKHYMNIALEGFDVNYDNFYCIRLQYKPSSGTEDDWTTLMTYFDDEEEYNKAVENGITASMIEPDNTGALNYKFFMDDMPDRNYDLRAVGVCMINNLEVENFSDVHTGIKDMYTPRLFGNAQPADGVLDVNDEIRLNFNEAIAEGLLTQNNFEVTGIRNGAQTDHDVSVRLDGNDILTSEFVRNWTDKDITVEMWIMADKSQDAVLFSHGNAANTFELSLTADNHLKVKVGDNEVTSTDAVQYEAGNWAHVAVTYSKDGRVSAYYNFVEYISNVEIGTYRNSGTYVFGASINEYGYFSGKMHNVRIWDTVVSSGRLQTNSLVVLSGMENNLMAYYPMDEAKGSVALDKARGANLDISGTEWTLPEGRAAKFNGTDQYVRINTGSTAVIDGTMDYTVEFWFNAEPGQADAVMLSNGRGDGQDMGGSDNLFSIGFESGELTFRNNGQAVVADGNFIDGNWHHMAIAISRTSGRGQIYIDGSLNTYFNSIDFGGVSAAYMYVGARGWEADGSGQATVDRFFRGSVDELRLWNLYRNETIVSNNFNVQLDGTEKGLLGYYPFEHYIEWQGTQELQFTLEDKRIYDDPSMANQPGQQFGASSVESVLSAPVKTKGSVSNLSYDFVVNNDALIITLTEPMDRIEKTIVTFTVDGVTDLNGNEMLSPVTWSAYINRNQLKWSENKLSIEKSAYEEYEFTLQAVNTGGSIQHFYIENLPAWLEVSATEGQVGPLDSEDITFTINPGLNVGTYDEVIYLSNDNGVREALELTVKVMGEKPDWSVDPSQFKYNMTVFGKMKFEGVFSNDKEDMLAVFKDGKCIGVNTGTYDKDYDLWYVYLTVYNNEKQADNLEFRMWDASTGKMYIGKPSENIIFSNDAVYGNVENPVIFDGKEIFVRNIALNQGWNWISFNLANENLNNVNSTLVNGVWTSDDVVKSENTFDSYSVKKETWNGTLSAAGGFNNTSMFMLHSSEEQVLSVVGSVVNPSETSISVKGGLWNYISYIPSVNYTVKEALAGYEATAGDIIKSQDKFAMYSGKKWVGSLTYMEAGRGYMLKRVAETDTEFKYPSTGGSLNMTMGMNRALADMSPVFIHSYNMSIVAVSEQVIPGDRILAYVDGELRGESKAVEYSDKNLNFVSVAGDIDNAAITFRLERDGQIIAESVTPAMYIRNAVNGTLDAPLSIVFTENVGFANVYPTQFAEKLNIDINLEEASNVTISIYDIAGSLVWKHSEKSGEGWYHAEWNGENGGSGYCSAGSYLVRIELDNKVCTYKVEKK